MSVYDEVSASAWEFGQREPVKVVTVVLDPTRETPFAIVWHRAWGVDLRAVVERIPPTRDEIWNAPYLPVPDLHSRGLALSVPAAPATVAFPRFKSLAATMEFVAHIAENEP